MSLSKPSQGQQRDKLATTVAARQSPKRKSRRLICPHNRPSVDVAFMTTSWQDPTATYPSPRHEWRSDIQHRPCISIASPAGDYIQPHAHPCQRPLPGKKLHARLRLQAREPGPRTNKGLLPHESLFGIGHSARSMRHLRHNLPSVCAACRAHAIWQCHSMQCLAVRDS